MACGAGTADCRLHARRARTLRCRAPAARKNAGAGPSRLRARGWRAHSAARGSDRTCAPCAEAVSSVHRVEDVLCGPQPVGPARGARRCDARAARTMRLRRPQRAGRIRLAGTSSTRNGARPTSPAGSPRCRKAGFGAGPVPEEDEPPPAPALQALRFCAASGTSPWAGGFDAVNFGGSILHAIRAAGGDGWFPWWRDATPRIGGRGACARPQDRRVDGECGRRHAKPRRARCDLHRPAGCAGADAGRFTAGLRPVHPDRPGAPAGWPSPDRRGRKARRRDTDRRARRRPAGCRVWPI